MAAITEVNRVSAINNSVITVIARKNTTVTNLK